MQISALPLMALLSKLRNATSGFNVNLLGVADTYRVDPFVIEFPLDVYSPPTVNFSLGQLSFDDIESSGVVAPDRMVMFTFQSSNMNFEKPRDFSGIVQVGLDVQIGWVGGADSVNFEAKSLAVEDAVAQTIQPYLVQNWGAGVVYAGAFSCQRGAVVKGGQGDWYQIIAFRMSFQIDVG